VRVDRLPLNPGTLGDRGDARTRRPDARMQGDGRVNDSPARLGLALGSLLQLVLPFHRTLVYSEFDRGSESCNHHTLMFIQITEVPRCTS